VNIVTRKTKALLQPLPYTRDWSSSAQARSR